MNVFLTLLRRDLAGFFLSLTGYVIIAAVTLIIGLDFATLMSSLVNDPEPSPMPVTELFYSSYFFWLVLVLIAPIITMRLFALEKSSGTFETLMTTPVGDLQVVAAKFAAAIIFYMVVWLPLVACLFIVRHFANQTNSLDAGTVGGMFLGIFLVGSLFLSLGCFASSITRTQMVAAMVSGVLGIALMALAIWANHIDTPAGWQEQVLSSFAMFKHMDNFARGVVDIRTVVFYVSLTFFFLFLTLRVVESRRWK
ncbi:MAG TPA: ABC transporter permease [Pseudomonadales bacterium]|nr:ABC transporter permease [Pseudomonadales bacterium]